MNLCCRELADQIESVLRGHLAVLFPLDTGEFNGGHWQCLMG
jgi:hypothetical protein